MKIWVDADACPVVIKEILYRAADRTGVLVTLVANKLRAAIPSKPAVGMPDEAAMEAALKAAASQRARPGYAKLAVDPALEYATFASVDVEEADELLVQARNVEALPTYQLVQNGRLLLQFTGSDDVKLKMETIRFGRGLGLSTQKHRLAR